MEFEQRVSAAFERRRARRLRLGNPKSILDIGSGEGTFGDALKAIIPGARVVSLDNTGKYHRGQTPFVVASAEALPFKDKEFDVSIMIYSLHHFVDPEKALREAKRVSNKIVVQEPAHRIRWMRRFISTHTKTDKEWQELFSKAGLTVTRKKRRIGFPFIPTHEYHLISSSINP